MAASRPSSSVVLAVSIMLSSCTGYLDGTDPSGRAPGAHATPSEPGGATVAPVSDPALVPPSGVARLTRAEYRNVVLDLLGVDLASDLELLPPDPTPFDNDYTLQVPSTALVEGLRLLSTRAAEEATGSTERLQALTGCDGQVEGTACLRTFVERFGRRALRRPLTEPEVAELLALASQDQVGGHATGVSLVIRALLQDLELVYRIERGSGPAGSEPFPLSGFELASRLAFLIWGRGPDDALLDAAQAGLLLSEAGLREAATRLFESPEARQRVHAFHAMWLGYAELPQTALRASMLAETNALVERVIFEERRPWLELLTWRDTYVDAALAEHYGLPAPAGGTPTWVSYGASQRQGILSHATVLSNGMKGPDTSPVLRGKFVREQLLCQPVAPPPPEVNVDEPVTSADQPACKSALFAQHSQGSCAGCHALMDPIGFGLEAYDGSGKFRSVEAINPACPVEGVGQLDQLGAFRGPGELGELLAASGGFDECVVRQLVRFASGTLPGAAHQPMLDALAASFSDSGFMFDALLLELISGEWFRYRRME